MSIVITVAEVVVSALVGLGLLCVVFSAVLLPSDEIKP